MAFTEALLARPPEGVTYTTYIDALADGTLVERGRRPKHGAIRARDAFIFCARGIELALRRTGLLFREPYRYLTVDHYFDKSTERYGVTALRVVDRRAELLSTDATIDTAFDSYALIRASYLARRNYLVHDGQVPDVTYDDPPPDDNTDTKTDTPK